MESPSNPVITVRVNGQEGIFATVATMLGFHPVNSAVLVCLSGERRRVGPVVRVDLAGLDQAVSDQFAGYAVRYADEVVVAIYTDDEQRYSWRGLASTLAAVVPVLDVVVTGNAPHVVSEELAAASALHGRRALDDRTALAKSVEHQPGLRPSLMLGLMDTLADRDRLIDSLLEEEGSVALLVGAAQSAPDDHPHTADLCGALAIVAYRHGDGALAQVACDRAQRLDPDHRLAGLMIEAMRAGLSPGTLAQIADIGTPAAAGEEPT